MAFNAGLCDRFKLDQASATHNFSTDTFKMALYTQAAATTLDFTTLTAYTTTGEVTGTGYVAGGTTMATVSITQVGNLISITWTTNPSWPSSTITADSCLLYNSSKSNKAVAIFAFSSTSSSNSTFQINLPPAGSSAILTEP